MRQAGSTSSRRAHTSSLSMFNSCRHLCRRITGLLPQSRVEFVRSTAKTARGRGDLQLKCAFVGGLLSRPLWGSSLSKLPKFSCEGPGSCWPRTLGCPRMAEVAMGGRTTNQQKFFQWSGPQVLVVTEVLDTGIQRGPQLLACPNPCCDLHNLHILKSCIVYF